MVSIQTVLGCSHFQNKKRSLRAVISSYLAPFHSVLKIRLHFSFRTNLVRLHCFFLGNNNFSCVKDLLHFKTFCQYGNSMICTRVVWMHGVLLVTEVLCGLHQWRGQIETGKVSTIKRCKNSQKQYKPHKQASWAVVWGGLVLFGSTDAT